MAELIWTFILILTPDPNLTNKQHATANIQLGLNTVADQKILKKGAEDNFSAPSSFIANAHNEMHTYYTEKAGF